MIALTGNRPYFLAFTLVTAVIGGIILSYGYWEHRRSNDEIKGLFLAHVDSVASLVREGAYEAASATAIVYELTEEHLLATAKHLAALEGAKRPSPMDAPVVHLTIARNGDITGSWGPIPENDAAAFIAQIQTAEFEALVNDGIIGVMDLICLRHDAVMGEKIVCILNEQLKALHKETGIGRLLNGVIKQDVLYVGLQDESGILAVAPSQEWLSTWEKDPSLAGTLASEPPKAKSRLRDVNNRPVFEGLIPFKMMDESMVVLRVGIDATVLATAESNAKRRFAIMSILVCGICFLVGLLTLLVGRWQSKQDEIQKTMAANAEQARHWETIGQMAATVVHEVRNPLNTIQMISSRLTREFSINAKERKEYNSMLDLLTSESGRINNVLTDFLDLGNPIKLIPTQINVIEALDNIVAAKTVRAKKEDKTLVLDPRVDATVEIDHKRFVQITSNLIDNALDAIEPNGRVTVSVELMDQNLVVSVADNGPGMPADVRNEVMKPFVSYKSTGTGLGLPLVERLIEAHGGAFELSSQPGRGTIARVIIPHGKQMDRWRTR
ncbi:MAG: HAMP domain-containing sensor histidine kinase [Myxococcota bacterium]|nr:HAMP domain-containing sensor histidine kinase [Myxococcota bacterium]